MENKEKTFTEIVEEISDEEFDSLTGAIKKRYDIDFTNYEKKSLKRGFARLITKNKFSSILVLWQKIINDREFFFGSIDELLVNLTELFRNPEIWVKIRDKILPVFAAKQKIKIWHAGCSTGEEIYTMAIVLKESNMFHKTEIHASDFSGKALEGAKKGVYTNLLWRKYLTSYLKYFKGSRGSLTDYFTLDGEDVIVNNNIKSGINFRKHNLVTEDPIPNCNIIFCRNVMIYFDNALKVKLITKFHDALEDGGFLIIGYYDMLPTEVKGLFDIYDSETRIYQKKPLN